jgi:hypothetical protein
MRILIVALVTLILTGVMLAATGYVQEKKTRDLAEEMVKSIYSTWDAEYLRDHSFDELREQLDRSRGTEMFGFGQQQLGKLERVGSAEGGAGFRWGTNEPLRGFYAQYTFKARFSKGDATLDIGLMRQGGEWRITSTRFNSEAMFNKALKKGIFENPARPRNERTPPAGKKEPMGV